jgi:hypothetical protein
MNKIDVPINGSVKYREFTLAVVQQTGNSPLCAGCFFTDGHLAKHGIKRIDCHKHNLACTPYTRKDKCNVIFKPRES